MIDVEDPATFDDGYYEDLSSTNQRDFEELFEDNTNNFDEENIRRQLRAGHTNERTHFELIRAACGCFHPGGGAGKEESGFQFAGTNPLVATEATPADAAIVNEAYNAVTVEIICCEVGGESQREWVDNINAANQFFSSERGREALERYFGIGQRELEIGYITLVDDDDTTEMEFSILDSNCEAESYAVWECDSGERCIRHAGGRVNHPDLEAALGEEVDCLRRDKSLYVAFDTHAVVGLEEIVFRVIRENQFEDSDEIDEFDRETFTEHYDELLTVMCSDSSQNEIVDKEVSRHLDTGEAARILTRDSDRLNTAHDYRVLYSGTRGPEQAQRSVEERFFENMPAYERGRRAYSQTREEFEPGTELSDFD
jgi:hypothetical protein